MKSWKRLPLPEASFPQPIQLVDLHADKFRHARLGVHIHRPHPDCKKRLKESWRGFFPGPFTVIKQPTNPGIIRQGLRTLLDRARLVRADYRHTALPVWIGHACEDPKNISVCFGRIDQLTVTVSATHIYARQKRQPFLLVGGRPHE